MRGTGGCSFEYVQDKTDPGVFYERSNEQDLCKNPLVTVRLVAYNHEKWIEEAIESVVCQECPFEYEILVLEDCSTDRTREICFQMQQKYPQKIRVVYGARNEKGRKIQARTLACARGKYVAMLEGDDYWDDKKKLAKQIACIRETGSLGCVAYYSTLIDGKKEDRSVSEWGREVRLLSQKDVLRHYLHTSTYVFNLEAYRSMIGRYGQIAKWYDTTMLNIFANDYPLALCPERLSVYRYTGEGIYSSLQAWKKMVHGVCILLDLYRTLPSPGKRMVAKDIFKLACRCTVCRFEQSPVDGNIRWRFFLVACAMSCNIWTPLFGPVIALFRLRKCWKKRRGELIRVID